MIFEKSLFERIDADEHADLYTTEVDKTAIINSVRRHLIHLFNTREGNSLGAPGYGMPDFNDAVAAHPDFIKHIRVSIEEVIAEHEPRLKKVSVKYIANPERPLDLKFQISGEILVDGRLSETSFDISVGGVGNTRINS